MRRRRRYGKPAPRLTAAEKREAAAQRASEEADVEFVEKVVGILNRGSKHIADGVGYVRVAWTFKKPREEASEIQQAKLVRRVMGRGADGHDMSWTSRLEPSFAFYWNAATAAQQEKLAAAARRLDGVQVHVETRREPGVAAASRRGPSPKMLR